MTAAAAEVPIRVRPMQPTDMGFVWETSLKVRKPHGMPWNEWLEVQGKRFRDDITAEVARVYVLDADGVLIGFSHFIGGVLRMLYVKRDLRGFGYGLQLLAPEWDGIPPLYVHDSTPSFRKWAHVRRLAWREVTRCR